MKVYLYPKDCGDGSVAILTFRTREEAEQRYEQDLEYGCFAEDGIVEFDTDNITFDEVD